MLSFYGFLAKKAQEYLNPGNISEERRKTGERDRRVCVQRAWFVTYCMERVGRAGEQQAMWPATSAF